MSDPYRKAGCVCGSEPTKPPRISVKAGLFIAAVIGWTIGAFFGASAVQYQRATCLEQTCPRPAPCRLRIVAGERYGDVNLVKEDGTLIYKAGHLPYALDVAEDLGCEVSP